MTDGRDRLTRGEITKDAIQATAEAAATTAGDVATIITHAVRDLAGALGGFATEVFEIRDASRRAADLHVSAPADEDLPDQVVAEPPATERPEIP